MFRISKVNKVGANCNKSVINLFVSSEHSRIFQSKKEFLLMNIFGFSKWAIVSEALSTIWTIKLLRRSKLVRSILWHFFPTLLYKGRAWSILSCRIFTYLATLLHLAMWQWIKSTNSCSTHPLSILTTWS
jgi:hypothetical protein